MAVPATLDTVAVIGNGLIGHGMAQIFAAAGREVVMIGRREESLAAAAERIARSLADFEAHGLIGPADAAAAKARIRTSTDLGEAASAQLVLEAVPADRAVQDEVFGALDRICAPPTVIASGSGQPASDLVSNVRRSSPSARRSCSATSRATVPTAADAPMAIVAAARPHPDGGGADAERGFAWDRPELYQHVAGVCERGFFDTEFFADLNYVAAEPATMP